MLRTICFAIALLTQSVPLVMAQAPQDRERGRGQRLTRDRVTPNWSSDGNRFWYRVELGQGQREFLLVDAQAGSRDQAFDAAAVAKAVSKDSAANSASVERLEFTSDRDVLLIHAGNQVVAWNRRTSAIEDAAKFPAEANKADSGNDGSRAPRTGAETEITFENRMSSSVEIFWLDGEGGKRSYGKVGSGQRHNQHTFGGHRWLVINEKGDSLGEVVANDVPRLITIDGRNLTEANRPRRRNRSGGGANRGSVTPRPMGNGVPRSRTSM